MAVLHAAPYSQPSVMGVIEQRLLTKSPSEPFKFSYNPAFHMPLKDQVTAQNDVLG